MVAQLVALFRKHFIIKQGRRDADTGGAWWRLPDDPTRRSSAWQQLVVDLVAPVPFSTWHASVARDRVTHYDRLRLPVSRAVFLVVIVAALIEVSTPWWWMAATLWAATAQVALEIYLAPFALDLATQSRLTWVNTMTSIVRTSQPKMLLNVTGVLGAVACPLNLLAVVFAPPGGEHGWLKVAALAAAIFYVSSGLTSMFLDPPNYTENSTMPPFMHWIRPFAPLLSLIVVTALIAISVSYGRWEPAMIPVAYLCAPLALLLGGTIRSHDRLLAAAVPTVREAITEAREDMSELTHREVNRIKKPLEALREVEGVPLTLLAELSLLPAMVTHLHARAGINASRQPMALDFLANKILQEYKGTKYAKVTYEIAWGQLAPQHQEVAGKVVAGLCLNVAQALSKSQFRSVPKNIVVQAFTEGSGRDLTYVLAVHDHLPTIEVWCPPNGSLTSLRTLLRERYRGDLRQDVQSGSKAIIATWADRTPEIEVGKSTGFEDL